MSTPFTESEQRLEQHIADCGKRMIAAHASGDRADAKRWLERMHQAIRERTPEHRAKMTARIDSAIWFQSPEALELGRVAP